MQLFDEDLLCPKCGYGALRADYQGWRNAIERTCTRCGYRWDERPLDQQAEQISRRSSPMISDTCRTCKHWAVCIAPTDLPHVGACAKGSGMTLEDSRCGEHLEVVK